MTNRKLFLKIFQFYYREYLLYFICDVFVIAIFYVFISLLTHEDFMNPQIIDPYISSNIYAPGFIVSLFSLFFIPYSHETYNTKRKKDYGILLSIGMKDSEVKKNIALENCSIAVTSLIVGIAIGSLLSYGFFKYITVGLKLKSIDYQFSGISHVITAVWFLLLFILSISIGIYRGSKLDIIKWIKANRLQRIGARANKFLYYMGWIIIVGVALYLFVYYDADHNNYLLLSFAIGTVGMVLVFFNALVILDYCEKHTAPYYYKHLFILTSIRYRFQSMKKIFCLTICLCGLAVFFQGFAFTSGQISKQELNQYYPYQVAFCQIYGMNQLMDSELERIEESSKAKIIMDKEIEYIQYNRDAIFSDQMVNRALDKNYNVKPGTVLTIFQRPKDDGRIHTSEYARGVSVLLKDGRSLKFDSSGKQIDSLVGDIYALSEGLLIMNHEDYNNVKKNAKACEVGLVRLLNLESAAHAEQFGEKLEKKLIDDNARKGENDTEYYKIHDRYEGQKTYMQSGGLLVFLLTTVDVLLYIAVLIMLHFKLSMDRSYSQSLYRTLVQIGASTEEIGKIIKREFHILFLIPVILAILGASFYGYALFLLTKAGLIYLKYVALIGVGLIFVQLAFSHIYSRYHYDKLL